VKSITIIGAGLVGSLVAVYLAKRGYQVTVFERRPDMRTQRISAGRSINLALSDRGWKGIEGAGIKEDIARVAIPMKGRIMHSIDGKQTFQQYGTDKQAIYSVSRGGINMALMDCAERYENIKFKFNQRCIDMNIETATAIFQDNETGEQSTVHSDCIIGADGAYSVVRGVLQMTDRFNYSQNYIEHGYKELTIPPINGGDFAMEKKALHIWPRSSYMLIALPNMDGSFTCTLFFPFEGNPSFASLQTDEDILHFFKEHFPDAMEMMPTLLQDYKNNPTSSLITVRCFPWSYKDKVLLIGDAAHGIVPFFGQGMNCGFEDCSVLDELLNKYEDNDWERMFKEFETLRKPNSDAIAQLALENFVEMRDKVADKEFLLRKKIEAIAQDVQPKRFRSRYSMVSFSHIPYSESMKIAEEQDKYIDTFIQMPNINDAIGTEELRRQIAEALANLPERFGDYSSPV